MESFNLNYEVTYNIQNAYTDAFATKTELKLAEEEINMEVSKKTNSDEIISSINLSPEKAKIQSGKLDVDAIAEFTNSKLKDKGSTIINGSNITTGDIDATKVNVVNLNADNIKSGNIQSKNYVSNTSGTKINLENGTIDTKNFKVDDSGNVNVKGTIEGSTIKGSYFTGTTENIKLQIGTDNNGYMSNNNSLELVYSSDNTRILGIYGKFWNVSNQKACYFSSQASRFVFVGDVFANNISNSSRATLKKNFEKFNNGLDIVKNTDIYKYHFKTQNDKEKKHIGIVIGNKYRYKKEITTQNNDGIDLYSMIAVAYKAIQEQQQMIDDLKHEIEVLKDEK